MILQIIKVGTDDAFYESRDRIENQVFLEAEYIQRYGSWCSCRGLVLWSMDNGFRRKQFVVFYQVQVKEIGDDIVAGAPRDGRP